MRALAVLMVVLYHAGVPALSGGYVGVDVFFVISGFLITLHLAKELSNEGGVKLLPFYARRIRRLLPAAWLVILTSLVVARFAIWPLQQESVAKGALTSSTYLINMWLGVTQTDYLAGETPNLFQHYWSLAVEEQFYLVWPVLLVLSVRWWPRRGVVVIPAMFVAASFVFAGYLTTVSQPWSFFSLPTRLWELGVGGIVAICLHKGYLTEMGTRLGGLLSCVGLVLTVAVGFVYSHDTVFPGAAALGPVLGAALLILGGVATNPVSRGMALGPLQYFGRISYSLYLWHWPILMLPRMRDVVLEPWEIALLCLLAVVLADLTERFVERPTRFWQGWMEPRKALAVAAVGTVVCTVAGSAALVVRPSIEHGPPAVEATVRNLTGLEATSVLPSNLDPSLRLVINSIPRSYATGCHVGVGGRTVPDGCVAGDTGPRVALFGDSHGAQLQPALLQLATTGNLSLLTATKSACPSVGISVEYRGQPYDACDDYRADALKEIREFDADVVVVSNSYFSDDGEPRTNGEAWRDGLNELAEAVAPARVVVVTDGPRFHGVSPAECASGNPTDLSQCAAATADFNVYLENVEVQWAKEHQASVLKLRDTLCGSQGTCPVVLGNVFVYRDTHHLTTEFARLLGPQLDKEIDAVRKG